MHDPFDPRSWGRMLLRMLVVMLVAAASVVAVAFYQHHRGRRELGLAPSPIEEPAPPPTSAGRPARTPLPPSEGAAPTVAQPAAPSLAQGHKPETPAAKESVPGPQAKPEAEALAKPETEAAAKPEASPSAAKSEVVADPNQQAVLRRELAGARAAMAKRDFAAARRHVEAAKAQAQDPAEQAEAARVELLLANLQEFWKGILKVIAGLTVAQEISAGETQYIVVSVTRDRLTLRTEGRNRTYDLKSLPRPVVEALAYSGFAPHTSSKILLGTYLAIDPRGDRREARRLWEEARQEGEEVSELIRELDQPVAAEGGQGVSGARKPSRVKDIEP